MTKERRLNLNYRLSDYLQFFDGITKIEIGIINLEQR